jgi:hypothetical protein
MDHMGQVFIVVGYTTYTSFGQQSEEVHYIYPFTDPDEAMEFVSLARKHNDDVDRWEIVTETARTAQETYDAHRAWIKGE